MESDEYLDRLRRIETRLSRLCLHLGMDKPEESQIYIDDAGRVTLRAMDVPISAILRFLRTNKIAGPAQTVFFRDHIVASIRLDKEVQ